MFRNIRARVYYTINRLLVPERETIVYTTAKVLATQRIHNSTFPQFKDYCVGRDLVVCGAGPTLKQYQPIDGAVHIALNRAFMYSKVDFDFIFSQDYDGIRMVQNELIQYRPKQCIKLLGMQNGHQTKEIPEDLARECNAFRFVTDDIFFNCGYRSKFVADIENRPLGNMPNVGLSVMQFALYMRPKTLYIVGCDMSGGHFVNKNQTDKQIEEEKELLKRTWDDNQEKLLQKWDEFKAFAKTYYPNTRIVSVNPVGLKGVFEDYYQNDGLFVEGAIE